MSTIVKKRPQSPETPAIPPLHPGDRLTAEEFERRYDAMPGLTKAELVEGVVYMPSPVSYEDHAKPHFHTMGWMNFFEMSTPGVGGADNVTLRLPLRNRPQPDGCLFILPASGGQVQIDADGYIVGGPELVAEVSATSESYDLHDKLEVYERNGVQEYVVWRVFDKAIDWFVLRDAKFQRLQPASDGCYHSEVFPGLWLDLAALIRGDMQAVFQAVQRGVATPEHAALVARLQGAGEK